MSLINEALKRAKEAQQEQPAPPSSGPKLRPVEPAPARRGFGLSLPVALAGISLLALFMVWQLAHRDSQDPPMTAAARAASAAPPPALSSPAVSQPPALPASRSPGSTQIPKESNVAGSQFGATTPLAAMPTTGLAGTNAQPGAETPPSPPPLKLQAIFFNPTRPSAIVSGKTVYVSGRVGEFRVAAIDRETVTLVAPGRTNLLNLSE